METVTAPKGAFTYHLPRMSKISPQLIVDDAYPKTPEFGMCSVELRTPATRHICDQHDYLILRTASNGERG